MQNLYNHNNISNKMGKKINNSIILKTIRRNKIKNLIFIWINYNEQKRDRGGKSIFPQKKFLFLNYFTIK